MTYYKASAVYGKNPISDPNLITKVTVSGNRPETDTLEIKYQTVTGVDPGKPEIFGPPFWFTLHNGAAHYPVKASVVCMQRMKGFISGIPVMLPCETCSDHATAYIEANREKLDYIVSGRESLFEFFVSMHNYVNKRFGKPQLTVSDAMKIYTSPATVSKMTFSLSKN